MLNGTSAYATPWPWFPAEAVITPALPFSGWSRMILVSAPRTLNARIGWIDSILMWTWQPALCVNAREYWSGVGGRYADSSRAARSIELGVTPATSDPTSLTDQMGFGFRRLLAM